MKRNRRLRPVIIVSVVLASLLIERAVEEQVPHRAFRFLSAQWRALPTMLRGRHVEPAFASVALREHVGVPLPMRDPMAPRAVASPSASSTRATSRTRHGEGDARLAARFAGAYSWADAGVSRPVPIRQELPPWQGRGYTFHATTLVNDPSVQLPSRSRGVLEMLIGESGNVESAVMRVPIRPFVDHEMTVAAKNWRYQPALKDGRPVRYKESVQVLLR